ncbi:hypothetical protein GOV14_01275 [Candidatus Pacearchaeota archaeon]|nr:hypothetical protein [Candidatus Pacearchaeota archaeon]
MDNVFSWIYYPPIYKCISKHKEDACPQFVNDCCKADCLDYEKRIYLIPPKVKSPQGKMFSLDDLSNELEPLKFGNRKQIKFLAVLNFIQQALKEEIKGQAEFYV